MRILVIVAALFALSGCETLALDSVSFGVSNHSYGHHYPSHYMSYTLGFYSGHHYNGYQVYGDHGYRYYYAPRGYSHHHHYARPRHYVRPRHHNDHRDRDRRRHR